MRTAELTKRLEEWIARRTEGPLSWSPIGEKVNGYVIGWACTPDGTPLRGNLSDREDIVETMLVRGTLGELEEATVNYSDAEFVVFIWNHADDILKALRRRPSKRLGCGHGPLCTRLKCASPTVGRAPKKGRACSPQGVSGPAGAP